MAELFAHALTRQPANCTWSRWCRGTPTWTAGSRCRPTRSAARRRSKRAGSADPDRVHVFDVENHAGTPVYVHAKVCVIDDVWASVGSDNFNRRSWTHDSELSCAVLDDTGEFARDLDCGCCASISTGAPTAARTTGWSTRHRRRRSGVRTALEDW